MNDQDSPSKRAGSLNTAEEEPVTKKQKGIGHGIINSQTFEGNPMSYEKGSSDPQPPSKDAKGIQGTSHNSDAVASQQHELDPQIDGKSSGQNLGVASQPHSNPDGDAGNEGKIAGIEACGDASEAQNPIVSNTKGSKNQKKHEEAGDSKALPKRTAPERSTPSRMLRRGLSSPPRKRPLVHQQPVYKFAVMPPQTDLSKITPLYRPPPPPPPRPSQYVGVYPQPGSNDWVAQAIFNNKYKLIGCYATEKEAACAYDKAARISLGTDAENTCNFKLDMPEVRNPDTIKKNLCQSWNEELWCAQDDVGKDLSERMPLMHSRPSRFKGVQGRARKWIAEVDETAVGVFDTDVEAACAYDEAKFFLHDKKDTPAESLNFPQNLDHYKALYDAIEQEKAAPPITKRVGSINGHPAPAPKPRQNLSQQLAAEAAKPEKKTAAAKPEKNTATAKPEKKTGTGGGKPTRAPSKQESGRSMAKPNVNRPPIAATKPPAPYTNAAKSIAVCIKSGSRRSGVHNTSMRQAQPKLTIRGTRGVPIPEKPQAGLKSGKTKGANTGSGGVSCKDKKPTSDLAFMCTACGRELQKGRRVQRHLHPLLDVPVCMKCMEVYNFGEFTVDEEGKEEYCRWCGDGGDIFSCDLCPKGFCKICIQRNFGKREVMRIDALEQDWACYVCNRDALTALKDAIWGVPVGRPQPGVSQKGVNRSKTNSGPHQNVVLDDVSLGRERVPIPCVNDYSEEIVPMDFVYVTEPAAGESVTLTNNPNFLVSCECKDNCQHPQKCECAGLMGGSFSYNHQRRLMEPKLAIYECNWRCRCHLDLCKNRNVGRGVQLRLEVFRCKEKGKGWGVRCRDPIPAGTYVANYLGEIITELDAERRGVACGDEYLFNLDMWANDVARQRLEELGLKDGFERFADGKGIKSTPTSPALVPQPSAMEVDDATLSTISLDTITSTASKVLVMDDSSLSSDEKQKDVTVIEEPFPKQEDIEVISVSSNIDVVSVSSTTQSNISESNNDELSPTKNLDGCAKSVSNRDSTPSSEKSSGLVKEINKFDVHTLAMTGDTTANNTRGSGENTMSIIQDSPLAIDVIDLSVEEGLGNRASFKSEDGASNLTPASTANENDGCPDAIVDGDTHRLPSERPDSCEVGTKTVNAMPANSNSTPVQVGSTREDDVLFNRHGSVGNDSSDAQLEKGTKPSSNEATAATKSLGGVANPQDPIAPIPATNPLPAHWRFPGFSPSKHLKKKNERSGSAEELSLRERQAQEIADTVIEEVGKETGLCVDAKWYGNVGRFINHSCDPNLCKQTVFVETHDARMPRLAFFALWDIPAMEELTYDYGYRPDSVEGKQMICRCGAQNCRGRMY